jgi:hypothetical protein
MRRCDLTLPRLILLCCCLFLTPLAAWPQSASPQSRIVSQVNEGALVTLRGNTHPLAQPQLDQGAAPPDLPMARMLLVLKKSDAQESALEKLLDDQQDQNSPSYHQWLTPDQFGQQFGPSDQDIQTVAIWLQSHGFQVARIAKGRTVIEFSGSAAQVLQAFHTEIHKYSVNGEDHWANAGDPQIPAALAPVVEGVNSLHNFPMQAAHHVGGVFSKSRITGQVGPVQPIQPGYTTPCGASSTCYFLGPYDFATIYNVSPLWNATPAIDGTGQSIAIVGESNINVQDVRDFRNLFGLLPNDPQIIIDGPDPGLVQNAETEADLDVEWSGAVAKGATIKLVIAASTTSASGVDLAAVYAVENNIAPIISESFLDCELFLGAAGNTFQNGLREQAAAQGITYINASGDQGAAGCDFFPGSTPAPAKSGLMVNGLASSPYGIAVGGTDFLNFGANYNFQSPSTYWSPTNDPHQASARAYVPETTWNSTCVNNIFIVFHYGSTAEASCNNPQASQYVETAAGGGGKSNCTTPNGSDPSNCLGGYAKPTWQVAPGVPQDSARDIPDVSLFASGGFMNSAYIVCEADQPGSFSSCGTNSQYSFMVIGGTSASAPAFAGIMAMVNQYTQSTGHGNANYDLYKLASSHSQTSSACNATATPASTCIFHDVTSGTIEVPCAAQSPNCTLSNSGDAYGVLSGYSAGTGYDLATGLGSVNAYNLVHGWTSPTVATTTTLKLNNGGTVNITHGQSVPVTINVSPSAATGDVVLIGSPTAGSDISMGAFTLQNGAVTSTTSTLAGSGGTSYQVVAHYAGDGTRAPSDSSPVSVIVAVEPSKTLITIPVFDPNTGKETGNTPTSLVYGSPYIARMDVANTTETVNFPMKPVCVPLSCPTGSVTLSDSVAGALGVFPLNPSGYADYFSIQLSGGAHQLSASFPGDNSYGPSSGSYNLTVTPAPIQIFFDNFQSQVVAGTGVLIEATVFTNLYSTAQPTGTVTFYDDGIVLPGAVNLNGNSGSAHQYAVLFASINTTFTTSGTHVITAKYSGDANYGSVTTTPANMSVQFSTTAVEIASSLSVNLGDSVTITAKVTSAGKTPPMTGTFQFLYANPPIPGPVIPTASADANGNQILTATVTTTPQPSDNLTFNYSGDANYESAYATVSVNVIVPDFTVAVDVPNLTINAGQSGTTTLTATPLSNFTTAVALYCNVQYIVGASCAFNPASQLSMSNGVAASSKLTITTLPPSSSTSTSFIAVRPPKSRRVPPPAWWVLGVADGLAILLLSLWPSRKRPRLATTFGMVCLLCLVLGCGAGSNAGGGGGGGGSAPTSLTLSTSAIKVPFGSPLTFTATVNSSVPATGFVNIFEVGRGSVASIILTNNSGNTGSVQLGLAVGTHVITAQYSGDYGNLPSSTKGSINQVITGTAPVYIDGTELTIDHTIVASVTIQ